MFASAVQFAFESAGITDAALGVIDKAQQMRTSSSGTIALDIGAYLVHEVLPAEPGPRFLDHDCQAIVIQQKGGAGCAVSIGRGPLIRADVVKVQTKQCVCEVLHVELVLDVYRRSVLTAQPQLPGDHVKSLAELFSDAEVIHLASG